MKKETMLRAALAGLSLGLAAPAVSPAADKPGEIKCYGINSCGSHAKCAVTAADIEAVRQLFGKDFDDKFGKSAVHSCGSHAKCGSAAKILNWTPTTLGECQAKGGLLIDDVSGKRVAKKA